VWQRNYLSSGFFLATMLASVPLAAADQLMVTPSVANVTTGQGVTLTATVMSSRTLYRTTLGLSVSRNGQQVGWQRSGGLTVYGGQPLSRTFTWQVPANAAPGTYLVYARLSRDNVTYVSGMASFAVRNPTVVVNGQCGATSGTFVTAPPTAGLCTAGTSSTVTGGSTASNWRWQCLGQNGGSNDSCATALPGTMGMWQPPLNSAWHIQFTGAQSIPPAPVRTYDGKTAPPVTVYNLDLFDTPPTTINAIHAAGGRVICYFSAGSYEDWRPDAAKFPASVLGNSNGWPGERWLDIRQTNILGPIMAARMDLCRQKGFDAIDTDNMDAYTNRTGFPLTAADQFAYNKLMAQLVHQRGLSIGLKNNVAQATELLPYFDFAINEQCFYYKECDYLRNYVAAGKAVFQIEYDLPPASFCPQANALNFNSVHKNMSLDAARVPCR
jgi:hypothetical protein